MDKILLFAILIAIIILIIQTIFKKPVQQNSISTKEDIEEDKTEVNDNIYPYKMKYLLTKNEYYFYIKLKEITNTLNLQILAKIRLADLIEVDKTRTGSEWAKYFAKIKAKHIDFAIADNMKIIALLELDDSSHKNANIKERDSFVNNSLLKAGYTVIRTNGNMEIIKKALIDKGYHVNLYQNTVKN